MNENSPCGDCETIKKEYEKMLDDQKKELISFRGHGKMIPNGDFQIRPDRPFTNDEVKTLIKLILLGARKLHFYQMNKNIDASAGGIQIVSQLPDSNRYFKLTILLKRNIKHDCNNKNFTCLGV